MLERCWYGGSPVSILLLPLSWLFLAATRLRRWFYRRRWLKVTRMPVPVIVVGNITVGGSGKTPLVIWLVDVLREAGYHPAVVSRGYGGEGKGAMPVRPDSNPGTVGDEPVLIARRCGCPVWVGRRRAEAAQALLAYHPEVDVIVSDDGLQHYALARDLELVVIEGERGLGNGRLLPAGPLREPVNRLGEVDALVMNGEGCQAVPIVAPVFEMRLEGRTFWNLRDSRRERDADCFAATPVQAIAGIGNPARFFAQLRRLGLQVAVHPYPDHHRFEPADIPEGLVIMTEKDAVKCTTWASEDCWALRIDAHLGERLQSLIIERLKARHGQQTA
jgi:tetraacyldisaccharide 4'-kinase